MKLLLFKSVLILFIIPVFAQNQYSNWIFLDGTEIDFASNEPIVEKGKYRILQGGRYKDLAEGCNTVASISDDHGYLLFFTNGFSFYDADGKLLENGEAFDGNMGCSSATLSHLSIIKKPGNEHQYLVFFVHNNKIVNDLYNWHEGESVLHYVTVDMKIKKVLKNKNFIAEATNFNIIPSLSLDSLYLIASNYSASRTSVFTINKNGVHGPIHEFDNTIVQAVSPEGSTFASVQNNSQIILDNFDLKTGYISKKYVLSYPRSDFYRGVTFSNSGEYVYLVEHKNLTRDDMHSIIWSFNARAPNLDEFENSKQMVKKFDHRIYFKIAVNPLNELMFVEVLEYGKKYRISSLSPQDGCRFDTIPKAYYELNEFVWQRHIPDMPTFTLQNKNEIKFTPSVQEICPGDQLKSTRIDNADYLWRPPTSLNDTTIFNPTINYYKNDYKDSLNYVLRVIDQFGCYHYDSTIVKILPIDSPLIKGPVSICPGSDSISYWIENNEPVKNRLWWINGGEIVSGSDKDSILVNWGQSNPSASLQYISLNNNECSNETDTLQVKIFKELETDKPNGDEILECGSLLDIYHVQPKYKYYFDWQILGGTIKSGQGTNEIEVEWHKDTKFGKLWINESISTDLEVCFGVSDTLTVANPEFFGPENIKLDMVTNILDDSLNLAFEYNLNYPEYYNDIILQIKTNDQWQHLAILPKEKNYISVPLIEKNESVYDFRLASQSLCYETVYSSVHQNILLECRINEDEVIDLNWNEYNGWSDLSGYGILSANDDGKYEEKIAGISKTNLIGDILYDGFQHKIYSFAENESGKIALSNQCFIAYDFPLWAPNVITPNGDGYNDKFIIHNLEKHQENELYIYDRWGNMKGSFKNYRNDWSPYKLEPGVYYYLLKTKKFRHELKGWLHVITQKK